MEVNLVSVTPNAEKMILYIARVSSNNQNSQDTRLISYLLRNAHFSPFEHAHMTVQIKTSRAISAQLLRHRSFTFQELSQRYKEVTEFEPIELRKQAVKNRQSSTDVFDPLIPINDTETENASTLVDLSIKRAIITYKHLINAGVAREVARMILPLTTQTTLYMSGTLRSWIHYIQLRTKEDVQKEHRDIALAIKQIMKQEFPIVMQALEDIEQKNVNDTLLLQLLNSRGDLLEQLLQYGVYR